MNNILRTALPFVLGVACMAMYAYIIVTVKQLSYRYNVFVLSVSYLPLQFAIMAAFLGATRLSGIPLVFPHGDGWYLIVFVAVLYAAAQTLNYEAYATGGSVVMMGCLTLLIPVFSSGINYIRTGEVPNGWQVASYIAAVIMIGLAVKGGLVQSAAKAAALAPQ